MGAYNRLNITAEAIEQVLRDRGAPATVVGGRVLPAFVEMLLRPEGGTRVSQVKALQADISLAVGNGNIRIAQSGSHLAIQIGREGRAPVSLPAMLQQVPDLKPFTAILGMSEEGSPLMVRIDSPDVAHMLIAGTTGCGKTELSHTIMRLLIAAHRPSQLGMVLIDPKAGAGNAEFAHLCGRHLMLPPARSSGDAMAVLTRVVSVLDDRLASGNDVPLIVVLIDELADLCQNAGQPAIDALTRIGQVGRQAGIHLIACTQKPTSGAIGSLLKGNLPLRLVGRVMSGEEARTATGIAGSGAEKLGGSGDFIAVSTGRVIRFQAALPCMEQGLDIRPFSVEAMPVAQWKVSKPVEVEPVIESTPMAALPAPVAPVAPVVPGDGFDVWHAACIVIDDAARLRASEAYAHYCGWCAGRGVAGRMTLTAFGLRMSELHTKERPPIGSVYVGVRLI